MQCGKIHGNDFRNQHTFHAARGRIMRISSGMAGLVSVLRVGWANATRPNLRRLISLHTSRAVILLLAGSVPATTAAQPSPPAGPPIHVLWQFADIHVVVLGPNVVKINWTPLAGANKYFVQRNGEQISPNIQSNPAATAALSFTDNNAPANSTVTYSVIALVPGTIPSVDGTVQHGDRPHPSNAVTVVTPAPPPPPPPPPPAPVVTHHNDNGRTGVTRGERALSPESVSSPEFQKLFEFSVDGQVYGQPLFVPDVPGPDGIHRDLLVVVTEKNKLFVFDTLQLLHGSVVQPLFTFPLGTPLPFNFMAMGYTEHFLGIVVPKRVPATPSSDPAFYNISPSIGVTSTPVVDVAFHRVYLVAKVDLANGSGPLNVAFQLRGFDLSTQKEITGSPVTITGSVAGSGPGNTAGTITFNPSLHHQRAALLLSQGKIYVSFGSHQDTPVWHGWIMRYDQAALTQDAIWCSTPNGQGGSIWQAGGGPVADASGNLYVMTGNGENATDVDTTNSNFAQSFVKLDPNLKVLGSFTVPGAATQSADDVDLGSSGPVAIPGQNTLIGAGKDGKLVLIDRATTGMREMFQASLPEDGGHPSRTGLHHVHGVPVVWRSPEGRVLVYLWPERDHLRVFEYDTKTDKFASEVPIAMSQAEAPHGSFFYPSSMPGGALSLSVDETRLHRAVLWASHQTSQDALRANVPGTLRAFDAEDVTKELWNSEMNSMRDAVGLLGKYVPPTIAGGRVYLATFSDAVSVYGLKRWATFNRTDDPPSNLKQSGVFTRMITFENTGDTIWRKASFQLVPASAAANNWSVSSIQLPRDVNPGEWVQVTASFTAPSTAGQFAFSWRMSETGVSMFGEASPTELLSVNP
jgi:hypothetical protein